jgi:hypothetical protein
MMRRLASWMLVALGLWLMVAAAANGLAMHSLVGALHAAVGIIFLTRSDKQ